MDFSLIVKFVEEFRIADWIFKGCVGFGLASEVE